MTEGNYKKILEKISKASGLGVNELEDKVRDKRNKLSGLISPEGAAQVVASELGISFENEKLKIDELLPGMRKVNTVGKIINMSPIRTFTTKKGDQSKVTNLWIADENSNIKVVLWDTNHIGLIESGTLAVGSVVEINNGSMRDNELHLGSFSGFKPSSETLENVREDKIMREKSIVDFKKGEQIGTRAFVLQAFEPRFFHVCPECNKKATAEADGGFSCQTHGKVMAEKRGVGNLVIDDGTGSIRAVLFHETLSKLGLLTETPEKFIAEKENLLGKEMMLTGTVKQNNFFNNLEFVVDGVKEAEPDAVVKQLETR